MIKNYLDTRTLLKGGFVTFALLIVAFFLYISNGLVQELSVEEHNKMEIWAEATQELANENITGDMNLILKVIQSNTTIPVVIADSNDTIITHKNIFAENEPENPKILQKAYFDLKKTNNCIEIAIDENYSQYLYYDDSVLLKRLSFYPYIQLGVMIIFVLVAYFGLISAKRAEQNKVWVGLSKETAHQLGTPISSLLAWVDILQSKGIEPKLITNMSKDVKRLAIIAERFSKIGSRPTLEYVYINDIIEDALSYMQKRVSSKVVITSSFPKEPIGAMACPPLIEWVIENLCKNAIDAMDGQGHIDVNMQLFSSKIVLLIKDSGKGIPHKNLKSVFKAGFTTKKRGWGLGLALVKRIVEEYHNGKVYVKESEIGVGSTFCIELPRSEPET